MRYILYARKSSESEDRQVQSIEDQINKLKQLAENLKITVIDVITESKSAKQPNNRPVFEQMLERIRNGEANGILCWQINRLSRNPVDSGTLQWMLQRNILQSIQTIDREYKPNDNAVLLSVESGVANQFIIDLRKNTIRGMEGRVEKGWMPNMAPMGYLNAKDDEGRGIIIPDPERFELVERMWRHMLTGTYSARKIAELANNKWGFRTRKLKRIGNNPISESGVYRIFNNQFYVGNISYQKKWHKGSHKPMITLDEFDYVQKLLGKNGRPRPQIREFPFTGFIRCGECGCLYTAEIKRKFIKSTSEIKTYTYYHCTRKRKDMVCSQRSCVKESDLMKQIDDELKKMTILPEFRTWALESLAQEHEKEVTTRSTIYKSQQSSVLDLQNQLDNLTKMRIKELIDDEGYVKERDCLKLEMDKVKSEIQKTENRAERWLELTEQAFDFATYARIHFLKGNLHTKRELMMALGSNPTVLNGKLVIPMHKWFAPITESYPALEAEYQRFEPVEKGSVDCKSDRFEAVASTWLRGWGSNPRPKD